MTRVISVFLPTWSADRRSSGDTAPQRETPPIWSAETARRVVLAADAAQAAGLRIGMPWTKAQALVQGLVIQDADLAADARRSIAGIVDAPACSQSSPLMRQTESLDTGSLAWR